MARQWDVSKEVHDVKSAQWEGYKRMAAMLPDRRVLSVQLIRTRDDETAAVVVLVRNGQPVQQIVFADARGRVYADQDQRPASGDPGAAASARASVDLTGTVSPDTVALGQPPISEPPGAAALAIANAMLNSAFDQGETAASTGV